MSLPADVHREASSSSASWTRSPTTSVRNALAMPPKWVHMYDDFITKNAGQVSQIESALRSLTYIIPGMSIELQCAAQSCAVSLVPFRMTWSTNQFGACRPLP